VLLFHSYSLKLEGQPNSSSGFTTLQAKQSKTKQNKEWGKLTYWLKILNPNPKPNL
jgi:hypothetical protein